MRIYVNCPDHADALTFAGLPSPEEWVYHNAPHDLEVLVGKASPPRYETCFEASTGEVHGVHVFCLSDPPTLAELRELRAFVELGEWRDQCCYCAKPGVNEYGVNGTGWHAECDRAANALGERRWEQRMARRG